MKKYYYYVYILQSLLDKTLYTGSTNDIDWRVIKHNLKMSKYTSKKEHLFLIFYSKFIGKDAKQKALKFEKYLKSGSGRAFIKRHILLEK
ncbi:GIY-YIG nuclease family protein [Patescibacteria group bacterium]